MKITSGWIKEWLRRTMLKDQEVVQALERAGIEIEQVILSNEIDKRVVVALVKKVVQHPGADRLKLVEVETGEKRFSVVCGAPNVKEGQKVAFAQIGCVLPGGDRIEKAKLRGEVSEGMICSEQELNLGKDHNGILELSNDTVPGTPIHELYPSDTVIDVKTPANRFDVQSIVGLAREVAAVTSGELVPLSPPPVDLSGGASLLGKDLAASRYMIARVHVNQSEHSPLSVVARLRSTGVRSIGPVVDITNYVMIETGQPLHAFDAAKVALPISVRLARAAETLITLDGVKRNLTEADLIIADAHGPIALAGVMGGQGTEVSGDTTEILLESAVFDSVVIRKMAMRHGIRTEASARFERGIPVALPPLGLARAVQLLGQICQGAVTGGAEQSGPEPLARSIELTTERLSRLLGFVISHKEAASALGRLQISSVKKAKSVTLHNGETTDVIQVPDVPWWRPDLKEPEDLVEEIVRMIGYEKVPSTIPSWRPKRIEFDRVRSVRRRVRDVVWAAGAFEVMTYSFVSADQLTNLGLEPGDHLKLKNPLSVEQAYLRSSLLPSHLTTLERNRKYAKAVRFCEVSNVFVKRGKGQQPDEPMRLGLMVCELESVYSRAKGILDGIAAALNVDLAVRSDESSDVYAPGRYGTIWLGDERIGGIGQIHPARVHLMKVEGEVAYFEVDLMTLIDASKTKAYVGRSSFPTISRDVALLVPVGVGWQDIREATSGWDVEFVGDYYGQGLPPGMRGMTIRLTLALPDRTPTEPEARELEESVLSRLAHKYGVQRRD